MAERVGLSRPAAGNAVDAVFEGVGEAPEHGEEVRIVGVGTFTTKSRSARTGRNPRASERLEMQASTASAFKPGKALRDVVNDGNGSRNGVTQRIRDESGRAGPVE